MRLDHLSWATWRGVWCWKARTPPMVPGTSLKDESMCTSRWTCTGEMWWCSNPTPLLIPSLSGQHTLLICFAIDFQVNMYFITEPMLTYIIPKHVLQSHYSHSGPFSAFSRSGILKEWLVSGKWTCTSKALSCLQTTQSTFSYIHSFTHTSHIDSLGCSCKIPPEQAHLIHAPIIDYWNDVDFIFLSPVLSSFSDNNQQIHESLKAGDQEKHYWAWSDNGLYNTKGPSCDNLVIFQSSLWKNSFPVNDRKWLVFLEKSRAW